MTGLLINKLDVYTACIAALRPVLPGPVGSISDDFASGGSQAANNSQAAKAVPETTAE